MATMGLDAMVELQGYNAHRRPPALAVYAVDGNMRPVDVVPVDEAGCFTFSHRALAAAHQVLIGPDVEDFETLEHCQPVFYPAELFQRMLVDRGVFQIEKKRWLAWALVRPAAVVRDYDETEFQFQILVY